MADSVLSHKTSTEVDVDSMLYQHLCDVVQYLKLQDNQKSVLKFIWNMLNKCLDCINITQDHTILSNGCVADKSLLDVSVDTWYFCLSFFVVHVVSVCGVL